MKKEFEKINIKEVIVVEGKDDISAVKKAVTGEMIATHGYGFPEGVMELIKSAAEKKGIIILTDPDFAGEKIRQRITKEVKGAKHAFLPREDATKDGDVGIENASPESIVKALESARVEICDPKEEFTLSDIVNNALTGMDYSAEIRNELGKKLGIGYANSKQLLNRLNNYGITREEFEKAMDEVVEEYNSRY